MKIQYFHNDTISLSWFDGSEVNYQPVFCQDYRYPLLLTNTSVSYTFISSNESC